MSAVVARSVGRQGRAQRIWLGIRQHWFEGPVMAALILIVLLLVFNAYQPVFNTFELQVVCNGATALALAAIGETLVVLLGGFDLSVGAVMAVVNVILATKLNGSTGHDLAVILLAMAIALGAGLFNGICVAILRLQSIIVTIATLFIFSGIALLVLDQPGGAAPQNFAQALTGTLPGTQIPRSLVVVLAAAGLWLVVRRSRFGKAIYAMGGDLGAAYMSGIRTRFVMLSAFVLSGFFYGAAGVYLTAQTASGDPRIGTSFLLTAFIAVVIGGTRFGGGAGSAIGSIIGAFIVTVIVGLLLAVNVNSFYTGIVEGVVLIVAVLLSSFAQRFRPRRPALPAVPLPERRA